MDELTRALGVTKRPNSDPSTTQRPTILAIDREGRRLEVTAGDDSVIVPYLGYIDDYSVGDTVLLLADATGPIALGVIGDAQADGTTSAGGGAAPTGLALERSGSTVTATWNAVASATNYRTRTSLDGGSTWAPATETTELTDTFGIGQGKTLTIQVAAYVGSWGAWSASESITYTVPGSLEVVTTTIYPVDSGTWRAAKSNWDSYNVGRWDWPKTLYQGNAFGSGDMTGCAFYGSRIVNLGATEITKVVVKAKRNRWNYGTGTKALELQGITDGSQPSGAPTTSGTTATTNAVNEDKTAQVSLPSSMREALRTGSIKGLAAVGSDDAGWYGTSGSMALTITYTRPA